MRPLGAAPRGDRRGDRHRRAARALGGRGRRRDPGPLPHRRVPALRGRARAARGRARARRRPGARRRRRRRCSSCSARRTCAAAPSSTRRYDQLVGSRTVRRPGPRRRRAAPAPVAIAASPSRSTARAAIGSLDPFTGGALAVLEAARNVACAGGEPLGFTDCLNFGNPEKPEIALGARRVDRGDGAGLRGARRPDRLRQRLALQRDRRPLDPPDAGRRLRRASCPTCAASRRAGSDGRRDPARRRPAPVAFAGSEYQARYGERRRARRRRSTSPPRRRSSSSLWRAAPRCSLAHDVSDGGLAVALAEAAIALGRRRRARPARRPARAASARAAARRSLACPPAGRVDPLGSASPSGGSARSAATSSSASRSTTCGGLEREPDVRRLRHPLGRARRRAALVLRPVRAAAPRPGVGRDRRLRAAAASPCCATWASSPRSSTSRSCRRCPARSRSATRATRRPAATHWSNAQPLVHHGARAHGRARPQRQPDEHRRRCATSSPPTGSGSARPPTPR